MSEEPNKKLILRYYHEMWNKWNFALTHGLIAKEISFRGSLGPEMRGRVAFCDYMRCVQAAFPDFHNEVQEMVAEGDRVVARLMYTGTHRGEILAWRRPGRPSAMQALLSFGSRKVKWWKTGSLATSLGWSGSCGTVPQTVRIEARRFGDCKLENGAPQKRGVDFAGLLMEGPTTRT